VKPLRVGTAGGRSVEPRHSAGDGAASFRVAVLLGCLVAFVDGFDVQLLPMLVPVLANLWDVQPGAFSAPMAATLVGYAVGGVGLAPLGDRIGRRPVLAASMALTATSMGIAALVEGTPPLAVARLVTGIGVGAALVTALAIVADAAPAGRRAMAVTIALSAFTVGAAASGAATSLLLRQMAASGLFLIGAAAAGVTAAAALATLPRPAPKHASEPVATVGPGALLSGAWSRVTLPLWSLYLLISFLMFFVTSWWPTILVAQGYDPAKAARFAALVPLGSLAGGFVAARLLDRGAFRSAFLGSLALAAAALAAFTSTRTGGGGAATILAIGFAIGGAQFAVSAAALILYPSAMRAAGAGWAGGIARIGSICAPLVGSYALRHLGPGGVVYGLLVPIALATLPALALAREAARLRATGR